MKNEPGTLPKPALGARAIYKMCQEEIANLYPGYFAVVMATGIVSIAAYLQGMSAIAWMLFYLNLIAFVFLWLAYLARLLFFFPRFFADLTNHARGAGFFTLVAGTSVLGRQFILLAHDDTIALVLWFIVILLWCVLTYAFFAAMTVKEDKPSLENGLNGGWLLAVVATQSVSLLGTRAAQNFLAWQQPILFFTLAMFLLGGALYLFITSLIFYRFMFFRFAADSATPPYWINMGAVAITTLAGATLISSASEWTFLQEILPFLKGFTFFFWTIATWWIPLLLILGVWRHVYKRFPLRYDPQYWGMVFPLGMYTTGTFEIARATGLNFLFVIPQYFVYLALFAWLIVSIGLVHRIAVTLSTRSVGKGNGWTEN